MSIREECVFACFYRILLKKHKLLRRLIILFFLLMAGSLAEWRRNIFSCSLGRREPPEMLQMKESAHSNFQRVNEGKKKTYVDLVGVMKRNVTELFQFLS